MRKKRQKPDFQYKRTTLVVACNLLDDLLELKADLPPLAVSYLQKVRRIVRWHLKHSARPKNGLDPSETPTNPS
jgi:hypothetical protein